METSLESGFVRTAELEYGGERDKESSRSAVSPGGFCRESVHLASPQRNGSTTDYLHLRRPESSGRICVYLASSQNRSTTDFFTYSRSRGLWQGNRAPGALLPRSFPTIMLAGVIPALSMLYYSMRNPCS